MVGFSIALYKVVNYIWMIRQATLTNSRPAVACCIFQLGTDANLHVTEKMDEAQGDTRSDGSLLKMLTETIRELVAFKLGNRHNGGVGTEREVHRSGGEETWRRSEGRMLRPTEDDKEDEGRANTDDEQVKERKRTVLRVLRELSVLHSDRVTAWRQVLRESVCMLNYESPPGGSDQQQLSGMRHNVTDLNLPFRDVS